MKVEVLTSAFDPWAQLQAYQRSVVDVVQGYGATAVFVGTMRDYNEGREVSQMHLEHYPGMTEKQIEKILAEAALHWDLVDVLVLHRVGDLHPSEPIVLVAVWSAHRAEAFEASRFVMEKLKSEAPFWKKEVHASGQHWVEKNTPGYRRDED